MKPIRLKDTGSFDFVRLAAIALNTGFPRQPPIEFQTGVVTMGEIEETNFPNHCDGTRRKVNVGGMTQYGTAVAVFILIKEKDGEREIPVSVTVAIDNKSMEYKIEFR